MSLEGKSLGLLVAARPGSASFEHAFRLAERALIRGLKVYLYFLDESLAGLKDERVQKLQQDGVKIFACAFGAHRRAIQLGDQANFVGLGVMSDVISNPDRFLAFT